MKLGKLKNIIRKGVDGIKVITQIIKSKRLQYTDELSGVHFREKNFKFNTPATTTKH